MTTIWINLTNFINSIQIIILHWIKQLSYFLKYIRFRIFRKGNYLNITWYNGQCNWLSYQNTNRIHGLWHCTQNWYQIIRSSKDLFSKHMAILPKFNDHKEIETDTRTGDGCFWLAVCFKSIQVAYEITFDGFLSASNCIHEHENAKPCKL